jgi:hypothetical protein
MNFIALDIRGLRAIDLRRWQIVWAKGIHFILTKEPSLMSGKFEV